MNATNSMQDAGDKGFVLVLAMMVLLIISLLGALSIKISTTEVITSGNLEGSVASFYMLESLGQLGVDHLVRQNVSGDDCLEAVPEHCLVKELHHSDSSTLPWLDEVWSERTTRNVYDLSVIDASAAEDDSVFPRIVAFPGNWMADLQRTARVPETLRLGNVNSLEPPGYVDIEDGGDDLIRFAVRDHGRRGVYSIGSDDSEIRDYHIHGLYHVGASRAVGYPGTFGIELGYRLELAQMGVL